MIMANIIITKMNKQAIKFHEPSEVELSQQKMSSIMFKIHEQEDNIVKMLQKYHYTVPDADEDGYVQSFQKNNPNPKIQPTTQAKRQIKSEKRSAKTDNYNYHQLNKNNLLKKKTENLRIKKRDKQKISHTLQLPSIPTAFKHQKYGIRDKKSSKGIKIRNQDQLKDVYKVKLKSLSARQHNNKKQGSSIPSKHSNRDNNTSDAISSLNAQLNFIPSNNPIQQKHTSLYHQNNKYRQNQMKRSHNVKTNKKRDNNNNNNQDYRQQIEQLMANHSQVSPYLSLENREIMKPMSVPLTLPSNRNQYNQQYHTLNVKPSVQYPIPYTGSNHLNHTPVSDSDSSDQEPVTLKYYVKQLETAYTQQCKQEINFLFFSTTADIKEWSPQIMGLFNRHDQELQRLHRKNKYLNAFDQNYFASQLFKVAKK